MIAGLKVPAFEKQVPPTIEYLHSVYFLNIRPGFGHKDIVDTISIGRKHIGYKDMQLIPQNNRNLIKTLTTPVIESSNADRS